MSLISRLKLIKGYGGGGGWVVFQNVLPGTSKTSVLSHKSSFKKLLITSKSNKHLLNILTHVL